MVPVEHNARTGVRLYWDASTGDWLLLTRTGRRMLGPMPSDQALEEFSAAVRAATT